MKLSTAFILFVLFTGISGSAYTQNAVEVYRWDTGLYGGTALYGDAAGINGRIETRIYLLQTPFKADVFAGAGSIFQYTSGNGHSMTNIYGYALGGLDWFFLEEKFPELENLALRAQVDLGGGYTSDKNTDDTIAGNGGFILQPSIGADYGFGKIHASLMIGYQVVGAGGAVMTAPTIAAGVSYSIIDRSVK